MPRQYISVERIEELKQMFCPVKGGFSYVGDNSFILSTEDLQAMQDFFIFCSTSGYIPWLKYKLKESKDSGQ